MNRLIYMAVLGAIAAAVAGTLAVRMNRPIKPARPTDRVARLEVPNSQLDLGTIWEADTIQRSLWVENHEPVPIEVKSISSSCNCLSIEPQSFSLEAGGRCELKLTIDASSKTGTLEEVSVRLTLLLNEDTSGGKIRGPEWTLRGDIHRAIELPRGELHLGRFSEFSQPTAPWTVPIPIHEALETITATTEAADFEVSVETTPNSGVASLAIKSFRQLPVGAFAIPVEIQFSTLDCSACYHRRVVVKGTIAPDIVIEPASIQVGGRRLNEEFGEIVTVRSMSGRKLDDIRVAPEGDGLSVTALSDNRFRVTQKVSRLGNQVNRAVFTGSSEGRTISSTLTVSYVGVRP